MSNDRLTELFAFLEADPNDAFTLYSIAYEYIRQKRFEESLPYFQQLRQKHPDYLGTYYHLGKTLEELGEADKAEEAYRSGLMRARKKGEVHTLSELQGALNKVLGLDYEDEV